MSNLINQPSYVPTKKVQAVGLAGTIVTVVLLISTSLGVNLPTDSVDQVAVGVSAAVTLVTFLAGYLKRNKKVTK